MVFRFLEKLNGTIVPALGPGLGRVGSIDQRRGEDVCTARSQRAGDLPEGGIDVENMFKDVLGYDEVEGVICKGLLFEILALIRSIRRS